MVKFDELKELGEKWAAEFCEALNNSPEYKSAAAGWGVDFDGGMLFVMEKSGEIEDNILAFLDLKDGDCLGITILPPGEDPPKEPIMTLRASMLIWKRLASKELDPIQSLMQGLLNLEGDMSLALRYAKAAMELANAVEQAPSSDELFNKYDLGE